MNQEQVCVCVQRHLQLEVQLLDQMESLCIGFSRIVDEISSEPVAEPAIKSSDQQLSVLARAAEKVMGSRQKTLSLINRGSTNTSKRTIRQFIDSAPESFRNQLDNLRNSLVSRTKSLQSRFVADSAVAFYSFDFYRRMINGLVNCIEEEKHYTASGKSISQGSGQLLKKVC